ncbi:PP2C family protein-serine/threonine phosphatase [Streptomyces zhihengii]|uniref:Serine/threonine-protein phosphatase n=1 Tax=Streptomyces zhihengii TaxID=1818004 RepID=A0ABS2V4A6_9ACTN|nr:PP2C family protein-serine/threonine phosphatase [Streptomyces zhihengii]MBM9624667.1 serine/threonine-protein phosphatase [Streptomyces zhihengii]
MTVGGYNGGSSDRSESFGEMLLGDLLDHAPQLPPDRVGPALADAVARVGGRGVRILLQDYGQRNLLPLAGDGLEVGEPQPIDGSAAGQCFLTSLPVEVPLADGVRVHVPMLDGGDQAGVLAITLDAVDDDIRRILRRLAALAADTMRAKNGCTDLFFRTRRGERMSVAAEIQWSLLPPLAMTMPRVAIAGVLEPAYDVAGDSFDYALNGDILHLAMIDAMGHGLDAATMATVAIGAYRHARRASIELCEIYHFMDRAIAEQFAPDHFVTAQMLRLDTGTGRLQWVNAGHPAPMLIRDHRVIHRLHSPTTLPVGFGGDQPQVSHVVLEPGDRILCFTDGLVEEHKIGHQEFGEDQLINWVHRLDRADRSVRAVARDLSHTLGRARGGATTDDATLVLVEWSGQN